MIRSLDTNLVSKNINWDVLENKEKKILKKNFLKFFFSWNFLLLLKVLKVRRPERKTSGFRTVRILKICRTSWPDVMSGRALTQWGLHLPSDIRFLLEYHWGLVCLLVGNFLGIKYFRLWCKNYWKLKYWITHGQPKSQNPRSNKIINSLE